MMATYEQPTCPKCSYEFDDEELWHGGSGCKFPLNDMEENTFDCPRCGGALTVRYEPMPHWEFESEHEDDEE